MKVKLNNIQEAGAYIKINKLSPEIIVLIENKLFKLGFIYHIGIEDSTFKYINVYSTRKAKWFVKTTTVYNAKHKQEFKLTKKGNLKYKGV